MPSVIDHLIMCVDDLDEGAALVFDRYGLASVPGGRHEGHGTANRIIPLGPNYLEILAVVDREEAETSMFGRWALERTATSPSIAAVSLRTEDLDSVGNRLGYEPVSMSRSRPDGTEISWRLVGLEEALVDGLPFFIQWDAPAEQLPGWGAAAHRIVVRGIVDVTVSGDPQRIMDWIGMADGIRAIDGPPGEFEATIGTDEAPIYI